jgi:hypothetical protein
LKAALSDK